MKTAKRSALLAALVVASVVLTVIAVEGVRSVVGWATPSTSVTYSVADSLWWSATTGTSPNIVNPPPSREDFSASAPRLADYYLQSWDELREWLPVLAEDGFRLAGDSPEDLVALSRELLGDRPEPFEGKLRMRPNSTLISGDINLLGGGLYVHPALVGLPDGPFTPSPRVADFVNRYMSDVARMTSDQDGHRTTLPISTAEDVLLVLGDSVPYGAMVADEHTFASFVQRRFPAFRVVNSSIPSSQADDHLVRLELELERYGARIGGVIYFHFSNDFFSNIRVGVELRPEDVVTPLKRLADREEIPHILFVGHGTIWQTMPELTGYSAPDEAAARSWQRNYVRQRETLRLADEAGFQVVDSTDVIHRYRQSRGSAYSGLALYLDHSHLSVDGNRELAAALPDLNAWKTEP
jgi:hypothetical protein